MKSVPEPPGVEDLSTSSEFLSLACSVKKVTRSVLKSESDVLLKQQEKLVNGHVYSKDDNGHALRSLKKRQEVQNLPAVELRGCNMEVTKENGTEGRHFTRQSARLQAGNKKEDTKDGSSSKTRSASVADEHTHEENGDAEVRRSCRLRRNRYENLNQSMLFDKLITNTAEAVLQKMDDMKKMRRRMREFENRRDFNDTEEEENLPMYSRVKQKNIQAADEDETTDNQDDGTGTAESTEEEGEENEEDEDGEDHQKRYDFRQRKAIERYQAPLSEPRHKKPRFYSDSPSPVSRRYRFGSAGPRSPFRKRRVNRCRHAIHSSDSTSSSSSSSSSSDDEDHFEKRRARGRSRTVLRGCLFYGPPGTGKTLVARALANECSIGDRRVSFFMRKGADCLSKWVGESERQLRLLFDQAYSLRPSIIFFDEIDGLAPVRSSRQDQIHSSIVSTLLALMDGLDSRGEVVVIGATNRLDSIDPALRRPGRFDREFLFNLPDRDTFYFYLGISKIVTSLKEHNDSCILKLSLTLLLASCRSACLHPMSYRPRLLLAGRPGSGQSTHLAPALLHKLEKFTVHTLDLPVLFGISATSPEESCAQIFREAKRTAPSIVYIPCIYMWWETVSDALRAIFMMLLQGIPSFSPILLLATCEVPYKDLSEEIKAIFLESHGHVFSVELPSREERRKFFSDLILIQAAKPPASRKKAVLQALEVLPVASPPEPRKLTEEEMKRLEEQEENTLRELRIFLRNVTHRLCIDKRFRIFTKPVDPEEVPDYYAVIKQPMDLSNVMKKIDLHNYCTAKDYLKDIDLMCSNALEYNPDTDPAGRSLRHRACTLKDTAYAILKEELDEEFEKFCEEIQESRKKRGCCSSKFAPSYCHVLPKQNFSSECRLPESDHLNKKSENHTMSVVSSTPVSASSSRKRHRRRSQWSCGTIAKKKKYSHSTKDDKVETEGDRGEHDSSMELTEGEINEDSVIENESDSALQDNFVHNSTSPRSYTDQSKTKIQSTVKGNAAESLTVQESSNADAKKKETKSCNEENSALDCSPQNYLNNETAVLRMTRARRSQVEHQQHIDVEKALDILSSQTPQLVVDHERLRTLLKTVTEKTEGFTVFDLEKVYAVLSQCIYQHRKSYDKTDLIENMEKEVDNFQR
ncbi:ATPase family AAA domain-containing protein 2 [Protopterus annectens]|uniref:ATPase family AAA domain-containing protein 2 n=1 Tax=Protopterus annectens TaxID=7888 RepID=UPI001CFB95AD|nr:ATPase family AAA domain-containing protein 2 [Protopterus annectens]